MDKINLEELYKLQAQLDKEIAEKHNITYETTHERRLLALIVEIGEFANETRCFKYWSNKGPSPKEIMMDEFADGLHFLLSLGIPLKPQKIDYILEKQNSDLTTQIHNVYKLVIDLKDNYDLPHYEKAFECYLNLAASLNMTSYDIVDAYKSKLSVNYKRQETNY